MTKKADSAIPHFYCYKCHFQTPDFHHSQQLSLSFRSLLTGYQKEILRHRTSMGDQNQMQKQVIGIPIRSTRLCLPDPATQYQLQSSSGNSAIFKQSKVHLVLKRMNKLGKKADSFANGVREHVRLGPKITETVKGKLSLGARILQVGGVKKVFKQLFSAREGERLLKACQCYFSTTAGPIAGLLFISTEKVAFCSDRSIKISSPNGELLRARYKVIIPIVKIKRVNQSENIEKSSQKYMEIVTVDDFDFWFMGFLNYQKAFNCIQQAISCRLDDGHVTC